MFKDYSHKQIVSEYNKSKLQEEAEKRGLPTSGTKEELAKRIKEYDAQDKKDFMFPDGPTTITARNREEAEEKFLDDNNS